MNLSIKRIFGCMAVAVAGAMGLGSCTGDVVGEEPGTGSEVGGGEYYIALRVVTPDAAGGRTRDNSFTTSGGNASHDEDTDDDRLAGTSAESALLSAEIFLCDEKDEIALELKAIQDMTASSNGEITLVAKIEDLSVLTDLASKDGSDKEYKLYVVGNASDTNLGHNFTSTTGATSTKDAADAVFSVSSVEASPIGKFGTNGKTMPMANADNEITITIKGGTTPEAILAGVKELFSSKRSDGNYYEVNKNNALDLERTVARLEYKGHLDVNNKESHVYTIGDTEGGEGGVSIQLYSLQPFNINKNSYLFRHTAKGDNTEATEEAKIFGIENGGLGEGKYNWIAGPTTDWTYDATNKKYTKVTTNNFLNPLTLADDRANYVITSNTSDTGIVLIEDIKDVSNGSAGADADGYHPFFYVTENTLPGVDLMADLDATAGMLNAAQYATGVAFRFLVLGKDGDPLEYDESGESYPSCISNEAVEEGAEDKKAILITDKDNRWVRIEPEVIEETDDPEEADKADKAETKTTSRYYLTYIGLMVHNNPDGYPAANKTLPPMYYGVVRNNTYQLSVKSVEHLPLPQEPESYYLAVDIRVLAWARRDITVAW